MNTRANPNKTIPGRAELLAPDVAEGEIPGILAHSYSHVLPHGENTALIVTQTRAITFYRSIRPDVSINRDSERPIYVCCQSGGGFLVTVIDGDDDQTIDLLSQKVVDCVLYLFQLACVDNSIRHTNRL